MNKRERDKCSQTGQCRLHRYNISELHALFKVLIDHLSCKSQGKSSAVEILFTFIYHLSFCLVESEVFTSNSLLNTSIGILSQRNLDPPSQSHQNNVEIK